MNVKMAATMEDDCIVIAGATLGFMVIAGAAYARNKTLKKRSVWVKPWILQRPVHGAYSNLFSDLLSSDEVSFRNFIRMDLVLTIYNRPNGYPTK